MIDEEKFLEIMQDKPEKEELSISERVNLLEEQIKNIFGDKNEDKSKNL